MRVLCRIISYVALSVLAAFSYVKGADWSHFIAGREEVEASGGRVLTIPLEPGYSTTNIENLILSRQP